MQKAEKMQELRVFAQEIRVETLKTVGSLGFGHVPGAMSVIDALAVLYGEVMKVDPKNPHWEDRDWCVLSKGHAGPAMYATLGLKGFYPVEDAYTLNQPHTNFPSHTDRTKTPGVDLTTGSLGQGISAAVGMALAGKMDKKDYRVYTVMGDGELAEGSVWEGAMSAGNYKLDNLCAIVDRNRLQISGNTEDVMKQDSQEERWAAFGWNVLSVPGNDMDALVHAFELAKHCKGKPTVIIANTTKGCGSSVMENKAEWHHKVPTPEEVEQIMKDLDERKEALS